MIVFEPKPDFAPVAISDCELLCAHCRGRYLRQMVQVRTPGDLQRFGTRFTGHGLLISGGFDRAGRLRNLEAMLPVMQRLHRRFFVAVHPGLVSETQARQLATCCQCAFVDIPAPDAIRQVFGLAASLADFVAAMAALHDAGVSVAPHLTVGLAYGRVSEYEALDALKGFPFEKLVVNVIVPTVGTPFARVSVERDEVLAFFRELARCNRPFAVGCMRPRGMDIDLVRLGVDELARLSPAGLRYAERKGIDLQRMPWCCGVTLENIRRWERAHRPELRTRADRQEAPLTVPRR